MATKISRRGGATALLRISPSFRRIQRPWDRRVSYCALLTGISAASPALVNQSRAKSGPRIASPETSLQTNVLRGPSNIDLGGGWQLLSSSVSTSAAGIDTINGAQYSVMGSASGNKLFINFQTHGTNVNRQSFVRSPMLGNASGTTELLIAADTLYTITVAAGNKTGNNFPGSTDNQTRNVLELLLDGTVKTAKRFAFGGTDANVLPPTGTDGTWQDFSISFTTDSAGIVIASTGESGTLFSGYTVASLLGQDILGEALRIRYRGDTFNRFGPQTIEFDNVRVDVTSLAVESVPEPATIGLAAIGLLGLGFVAWRRRRSQVDHS